MDRITWSQRSIRDENRSLAHMCALYPHHCCKTMKRAAREEWGVCVLTSLFVCVSCVSLIKFRLHCTRCLQQSCERKEMHGNWVQSLEVCVDREKERKEEKGEEQVCL